ncbi:ATP-binding cassette domain-containing protein [Sinomonas sp. JGH33]|uniref:ATP-binding cassette domain-containing protein n=1 Tax=Sinomonas terricola TaxID=3110330 RepID=A0ABU5T386_9MICC|nr:ATP-binding cassette domain-containing protein [Sinomonas sp. JGH33]MEA5453959.1 ATP-binding cassette domain-containing protein [Sinomonas sp. JGH33]
MNPVRPAIQASGLSYAFGGSKVLEKVTVDVPWGAVTALTGPNGAGKSTLVELLAGVRSPLEGVIERAEDVALVVQRPAVPETLCVTVRDVVTMGTWGDRRRGRGPRSARERARIVGDAIARVEMDGFERRPFFALSGGQRQRVLIAQGLARSAEILVLDEPAAGLDTESQARARTILAEEASRGIAVLCVTHDRADIAAADHVIRLERGTILS